MNLAFLAAGWDVLLQGKVTFGHFEQKIHCNEKSANQNGSMIGILLETFIKSRHTRANYNL